VLLGKGDGTFLAATPFGSGGDSATSVTVADVNGDGKPDLVVANESCGATCGLGSVGVLLGNGNGTFQTVVTYGSGGANTEFVTVADVNGDGKPDLLVASQDDPSYSRGTVGVLLGNGDGTFQAAVMYGSGGTGAFSVAVADVNGDGRPDLAVANFNGGSAGVLLGNGDGTFQTAAAFAAGFLASSIVIGDGNGDGKPDLPLAGYCTTSDCSPATEIGEAGVLINTSIGSTTTALVSSPDPSNFAQSVTFTATVTAQPGFYKGPPPGTVNFLDGTTVLGSSTLNSSGVAALTTSKLLAGTHSITASYEGSTDFAPSTSPVLSQTVGGAIAKLSASSVTFGNETVGMTSAAKSVTLTNKGNTDLTIASVDITGTDGADFVASKCPASIAPNGSCTISVTFKPMAAGTRTAELTVTDSAPSKVQKASLTGVGILPTVVLSPTSLTFPTQVVYTTSAAQVVTVKNTGLGIATLKSITVTGPFGLTKSCGTNVNPGGGCTFSVTFKPKSIGVLTGSLTVIDNTTNSPQTVTLTGTGTYVRLTPTSINFGNQPTGTASLPTQITLSNQGSVAVAITSIGITGAHAADFTQTNTCGTSVAAGASCFINVTFTPSDTGNPTAQVVITDNGGGSPQMVSLVGTGIP
ncbi:MAG: choice-of-anchor D domain-containing protein, partial [Candidatus Sulfotelmatobacter sp.]